MAGGLRAIMLACDPHMFGCTVPVPLRSLLQSGALVWVDPIFRGRGRRQGAGTRVALDMGISFVFGVWQGTFWYHGLGSPGRDYSSTATTRQGWVGSSDRIITRAWLF